MSFVFRSVFPFKHLQTCRQAERQKKKKEMERDRGGNEREKKRQVYVRDGSAQTISRAAALRQKLQ